MCLSLCPHQSSNAAIQSLTHATHRLKGLNLLLPSVLEDLAFAKDKREGLGKFVYQTPLWSLGVPDSCGYIDMHYCQIDAVPIFAKWGVCVPEQCTIEVRPRRVVEERMTR